MNRRDFIRTAGAVTAALGLGAQPGMGREEGKTVTKPNILVVVADTLRACDLGCYGSAEVRTPHMDAFAKQGVRFSRAYPESLPTIPVRRALHTGRRAFPFRDYRPLKWDIVYLPGWQAMDNDEDTLAENLAAAGYQTGFATDTLPYFAPGLNFTRGFWQWEFVRGKQQDRWKSPYSVSDSRLARYGDAAKLKESPHALLPMHLANAAGWKTEEDTSTAKTFQWAMEFLEDNRKGQPFYLFVDSFAPHEPWEAPEKYYRMYGDPHYKGRRIVHTAYGPADKAGYTQEELRYIRAQYCGLVTLVDRWLGKLLKKLDDLGMAGSTAVFLISDHGTNFCENPRKIIGKPTGSMYPGLMQLPLIARLPDGTGAGRVVEDIVCNTDLTATVYDLAGVRSSQGIHGRSLVPLFSTVSLPPSEGGTKGGHSRASQTPGWPTRPYATCRYGGALCYIDDETWALAGIGGAAYEVFDLAADPKCSRPLGKQEADRRWKTAWPRLLEDAGGEFPDYENRKTTDAIGQKPAK